jgi:nucleoside-diphosphate-sugar epimerase
MQSLFFTGFPGFLGSELLPRVLRRSPDAVALCLVQPKFAALAQERAAGMGELAPRIRIVEGDITASITAPAADVTEIYHLAAIYDLSVKREPAMRINVVGTRHVLDFAERCTSLRRLHYVSTCYVSGRCPGRYTEDDLDVGQHFNNFYEETKFLAEVEVRNRMAAGLPATIYRPSVVVGDSATGATQKFDGPYFVMQWLLRQPRIAVLPVVGRPKAYRFNVVPRDFVVNAFERLSGDPTTVGKCFALADPEPLTVDETIDVIAAAANRRVLRVPLPLGAAKAAIDYVPGVYRLLRIPSAAVNYFVQPTAYDTSHATAALAGSGITVPPFATYVPRLVEFARNHPEIGSAAMA